MNLVSRKGSGSFGMTIRPIKSIMLIKVQTIAAKIIKLIMLIKQIMVQTFVASA